MKIELHAHTSPVSPCAILSPAEVVRRYEQYGYDAIVVTNHYSEYSMPLLGDTLPEKIENYLADYRACVQAATRLQVILGAEVAIIGPYARSEFLLYGADEAFFRESPYLVDLSQKELYTRAHERGIVMVQAHPFRSEFGHMPQDPEYMDGVEINCHPNYICEAEKTLEFAAKHHLLLTAGNDYHGDATPFAGLTTDCCVTDAYTLAQTLRSGKYELIYT